MQKRSTFVLNRLHTIARLCETFPVRFSFVSGTENPADCITRCLSYKQLMKTNYFSGPEFLKSSESETLSRENLLTVTLPNPLISTPSTVDNDAGTHALNAHVEVKVDLPEYVNLLDRSSSFRKMVNVYKCVLKFINKLKGKLKNPDLNSFVVRDESFNFHAEAVRRIIRHDQLLNFPDIFHYYSGDGRRKIDLPNLVGQLNVYLDQSGLLRVRSKLDRKDGSGERSFPYLLDKNSRLTKLILLDLHTKRAHIGCYSLLSEFRKKFWVSHCFSVVKRVLKECVICRRFNERPIKVNQNSYRDFRLDPPSIPFRFVFMDHLGPFNVKINGKTNKVWVLCITCMWSRAVNLKVSSDLTTGEFLRSFQLHCFEYGVPEYCITDLGSQLVAGANVVTDYLKDPETRLYLNENGINSVSFDQYYKGCSKLGGMVETCVKMTKRLLYGSVRNNCLSVKDFDFLICNVVHLINRRPVAFKEALRDCSGDDVPSPITPECLVKGYDLVSVNVIPELHVEHDDEEWKLESPQDRVRTAYTQLQNVRRKLIELYRSEFLANLVHQATNVGDRYKPVTHKVLNVGDIVLLKEVNTKPNHYPMGIVKDLSLNSAGEVTGAVVMKGKNRELVKRHAISLIRLLSVSDGVPGMDKDTGEGSYIVEEQVNEHNRQPKRKAAQQSREKTAAILQEEDD